MWRTHLAVSTDDAVANRSLTSNTWPLSCRFSPFLTVASRKNYPTTISLNQARSTNRPATGACAAIAVKAMRHCCLLRLSPLHAHRTASGAACVFQGALYRSRTECIGEKIFWIPFNKLTIVYYLWIHGPLAQRHWHIWGRSHKGIGKSDRLWGFGHGGTKFFRGYDTEGARKAFHAYLQWVNPPETHSVFKRKNSN